MHGTGRRFESHQVHQTYQAVTRLGRVPTEPCEPASVARHILGLLIVWPHFGTGRRLIRKRGVIAPRVVVPIPRLVHLVDLGLPRASSDQAAPDFSSSR